MLNMTIQELENKMNEGTLTVGEMGELLTAFAPALAAMGLVEAPVEKEEARLEFEMDYRDVAISGGLAQDEFSQEEGLIAEFQVTTCKGESFYSMTADDLEHYIETLIMIHGEMI